MRFILRHLPFFIFSLFHLFAFSVFGADRFVKREVRGVWMATVGCTTLPLIGLPSGIYIVKARSRDAQVTKKIYLR